MIPLPANDLRSNLGTFSVPSCLLPSVAYQMTQTLPTETFDPSFAGQALETTYYDTPKFNLRKARQNAARYLVLRVRCYRPGDTYALSVKTEAEKFRREIDPKLAEVLLAAGIPPQLWFDLLPAYLVSRLLDLSADQALAPVVTVSFRRYAVEDASDRLTLDGAIHTDTGKCLPTNVLEFKSTTVKSCPLVVPLRPIKLSKFLWATTY